MWAVVTLPITDLTRLPSLFLSNLRHEACNGAANDVRHDYGHTAAGDSKQNAAPASLKVA